MNIGEIESSVLWIKVHMQMTANGDNPFAGVCLFVCVFVLLCITSVTHIHHGLIEMTFSGGARKGSRNSHAIKSLRMMQITVWIQDFFSYYYLPLGDQFGLSLYL